MLSTLPPENKKRGQKIQSGKSNTSWHHAGGFSRGRDMNDNKDNQPVTDSKAQTRKHESKPGKPRSNAETKQPSKKPSPTAHTLLRRTGTILSIIALLIAATGIAASYLLWQQLQDTRQSLTNRDKHTRSSIEEVQSVVSDLQTKTDSLESQLDKNLEQEIRQIGNEQQNLQASLQSLQAQLGKDRPDDWMLAEAEYLLHIANHRLQLEHDINTAIVALSIADTRLRDIGNPALTDVRKALSEEITALEGVNTPDITGMGLTLHSLEEHVAQLPVKGESGTGIQQTAAGGLAETESGEETGGFKAFMSRVWTSLKSLVTIRRVDEDATPLLPPEQRAFLKQNLRLQLETARLSLFRRDNTSFHTSLDTANDWLTHYFDTGAAATTNMLDTITRLNKVNIDVPVPDISNSLNILHKILAQKSVHVIRNQGKNEADASSATSSAQNGSASNTSAGPDGADAAKANEDSNQQKTN